MGHFVIEIDQTTPPVRLVNAKTSAQAWRFVAEGVVTVRPASAADVYAMAKSNIEIEDATTDKAAEATQAELRG